MKILLAAGDARVSLEGWALNVSRGGVRTIVDGSSIEGAAPNEPVDLSKLLELGRPIEVSIGDGPARPGKIVWVQEEADGAIMGIAFSDTPSDSGAPPPMPGGDASRNSDPVGAGAEADGPAKAREGDGSARESAPGDDSDGAG